MAGASLGSDDDSIAETATHQIVDAVDRCRGNRTNPILIALDGRSGTGKSTTARELARALRAAIIEGDDFYTGGSEAEWAARTPAQRYALCIDWQRMRTEALEPLLAGRPAGWHPFDWTSGTGLEPNSVTCPPAPIVVLDGVYSGRPELADLVDVEALLWLPDALRRRRLVAREGEAFMAGWHGQWDSAEEHYFRHVRPPGSFAIVVRP